MTEVKRYHVGDAGLVEGESLGRITVVLASHYDRSERTIESLVQMERSTGNRAIRYEQERDALQQLLNDRDEKLDAQRLRANTAEAERDTLQQELCKRAGDIGRLTGERDAAEQRIAEQASILEEMATEMTLAISDSQISAAMTSIGRTRFLQLLQAHNAQIDAALNPNPEAESHE